MFECLNQNLSEHAIPIIPLTRAGLTDWRAEQDDATRHWIDANGFEAAPASWCALPDGNGHTRGIVVGLSEKPDLWSCAALPTALPSALYKLDASWPAEHINDATLGWLLGSYQFTRYREATRTPAQLQIHPQCDAQQIKAVAEGMALTRDLINTPAGDMMPQHLAEAAEDLAKEFGASFHQIVGHELLQQNYPVIHAVGRASAHPPRLIDVRWGEHKHPRLTLVGKGVCFDSGGLDIKPANGMRLMKKDMGGAAHVLGLARMIMGLELPVQLRVLIPAVENAISGDAFRPGDVLTARNGKTIEIDNTDAEGRLVLCDAISEAVREEPDLLIDMATLTGAARVALGPDVPAVFGKPANLAQQLQGLSTSVSDPIWPMPLYAPYNRWLNSDIADLVNSSTTPLGGAITAALFLQHFVPESQDWMHMDVMAWNGENLPGRPRGGEAMGLRAFLEYLYQRYGQ